MPQEYGKMSGHKEHHSFKAKHHSAMAKLHSAAAAHHQKMAGVGGGSDVNEDMTEIDDNLHPAGKANMNMPDTVKNIPAVGRTRGGY